jgi:cell division protein FtsW
MLLDASGRWTAALLGIAFVRLVLVKIPGSGVEINGARRWIGAGRCSSSPPSS